MIEVHERRRRRRNIHERPGNHARPAVAKQLEVEAVTQPRVELDAHVKVVDDRAAELPVARVRGHQMRLDKRSRRHDETRQIHTGNEATPVPRDEGRVQPASPAGKTIQHMRDDPGRQAVDPVGQQMAGGRVLAPAHGPGQEAVEQALEADPAQDGDAALPGELRAVAAADGPEAVLGHGAAEEREGAVVLRQSHEDGHGRQRGEEAGRRGDERAQPGPSSACATPLSLGVCEGVCLGYHQGRRACCVGATRGWLCLGDRLEHRGWLRRC